MAQMITNKSPSNKESVVFLVAGDKENDVRRSRCKEKIWQKGPRPIAYFH